MAAPRRVMMQLSRLSRLCRPTAIVQISGRRALSTTQRLAKDAHKSTSKASGKPASRGRVVIAAAFAGGSAFAAIAASQHASVPESSSKDDELTSNLNAMQTTTDTKYFRLSEVKKHDATSKHPWVTKGNSVYDITDWVGAHPGGEVILRAAGGSIDPYWEIFTIHKKQDVYDILESYLIGKIDPCDLVDGMVPASAIDDPFQSDPDRDARLRTLTPRPCNAETPSEGLSDFNTPTELFYVRNHMWVPVVKENDEYRLSIELPDGEEVFYSLQDLKEKFQVYKITATLQCAGNRRKDMTANAKATNGLQWSAGAISSAEWEGFKLRDVLQDAGLNVADPPEDAQHAQFTGLEAYGASIPIDKAIDRKGDVLLAFRMNGKDLPPDHGYPLRVIVPGTVAARSVKWLTKIVISDEESQTQWQRRDYRNFGPNITAAEIDWPTGTSIQEMPITSAITNILNPPENDERRPLTVEGYAYSGGGREIIRVDISQDDGKTWDQAELLDDEYKGSKAWCWKRWRYTGVSNDVGKTSFLVKATDNTYNTQPQSYTSIYNPRGNLATAWHRVEYDGRKEKIHPISKL